MIERARAGEAAAFEQIMNCYQRKVVALAYRMLGNREDARDAAQETFLKAFRYLKSYDAEQDFAGWLYKITINACRDIVRKRGATERFTSFEAAQEAGSFAALASRDDVESAAINAEHRALIDEALQTLSGKERAALVLRDLEGHSTAEVARLLGSSQTTVRSQISTARAKLKRFHERFIKGLQR
ncbi:MAG: sigma-70 family RNA polymerase sigma factor [Acidobacteria bacterium]|nr:sigma-70 family RNA polymerase sigma factor [Acidobacteriota bacterium]